MSCVSAAPRFSTCSARAMPFSPWAAALLTPQCRSCTSPRNAGSRRDRTTSSPTTRETSAKLAPAACRTRAEGSSQSACSSTTTNWRQRSRPRASAKESKSPTAVHLASSSSLLCDSRMTVIRTRSPRSPGRRCDASVARASAAPWRTSGSRSKQDTTGRRSSTIFSYPLSGSDCMRKPARSPNCCTRDCLTCTSGSEASLLTMGSKCTTVGS
mmetsp:Transcript_16342/g.46365  ORF Transcript_16342/g.46365 Transcript_16342/m.46365 type:complete len:213 (+) Transcript_16342:499-1137(+)